MKTKPRNNELKKALETMLILAKNKLAIAIEKDKTWDIEHYKKDVRFIEQELIEIS